MQESKTLPKVGELPESFDSLEALGEFWDTHSTADYEEFMEPVEMEIELGTSKFYLPIAKNLLEQIRAYAKRHGVSTETLVNLWLQEKLAALQQSGFSEQ
jgi:hypothetical protein